MKKYFLYLSCTALLAASFCLMPNVNRAQSAGDQSSSTHALVQPDSIQWKPFFPGAEIAAISGDPAKEGEPFVLRIKLPDGMKVPPHWHPVDENITVLKGTFLVGMGEKYETSSMKPL
ncbi:MAG TPA: cupin domain-containing protein, partial [Blastocatellia bacterium]|nr:cupin domain-containing protein [Blastocatellia bacterium]